MPARISPNSSFRWILSAWKASFDGCIGWYSMPFASATSEANSRVRRGSVPAVRARQMASAMRRAAMRSDVSPYSCSTRISSSRGADSRNFHAGTPLVWSKRKSSGPSASGRKPRWASSNWGEEMPRSRKTPEGGGSLCRWNTSSIDENGAWWMVKRLSSLASASPTLIASGSMSKACSRPSLERAESRPRVWPPRPNVPSTYTPDVSEPTILAITSLISAGVCVPGACTLGRTPVCICLAALMARLRPPKLQPFHLTASARPSRVANVSQPTPLHLPVCEWIMSLGSPTISPAEAK